MKDALRVRAYNVLFGDALLVSVPESSGRKTIQRHILIDLGNVLGGPGGDDDVFQPVVADILKVLDGRPLDLYVMTHEHLDHVQGLYHASVTHNLNVRVAFAWLTASAAPDYYDRFPESRKKVDTLMDAYEAIGQFLGAAPAHLTPHIRSLMLNNDLRSTGRCVEYLRNLAHRVTYVYRGCDLNGAHPFREASLEVWAPEQDTSEYYGRLRPLALGIRPPAGGGRSKPGLIRHVPPSGVDAGSFFDLIEARRNGIAETLLAIDRAANNTSIVFTLEWRGWRLLFPGDAEQRSWRIIKRSLGTLKPVHFLKVSHHGSQTGMPPSNLLDELLPSVASDSRSRSGIVCTCPGSYVGVPHAQTLSLLRGRCPVQTVESVEPGSYLDVTFPG